MILQFNIWTYLPIRTSDSTAEAKFQKNVFWDTLIYKADISLQIMTGRALRLLVTNIRTRPTVAATVPRLVWLEPYSSSLASRNTFGTSSWLQNSLSDEEEVILLVGTTNNQSRMR